MTIGAIYPFLNAAHILGIALLLGAALPMDQRLLGAFRSAPLTVVVPFLSRLAGAGLAVAFLTGVVLFLVNPADYWANAAFRLKLGLLAAALVLVAVQHRNPAYRAVLAGAPPAASVRLTAGASALVWLAMLLAGRWIGFL
ncbi:MAG TPA: DUF2214 domain-containing protein [Paracoccaceae bacterium]|nr:DUF2214 domain-containing protein [Paracoccaceae bacterium]